jgi:hypothetical protein
MQSAEKAGVDIPQVLIMAIQPPISEVELELNQKAEWFARWLSTDQGQSASMPLRSACEMLAQGMFQGAVQQQSMMAMAQGAVQTAGAAIPAMGQAAMEQQGQQEPQIDPQAQMQAEQEAAQQQGQFQENERQRQHERKTQESQQKHELRASKVDADNKIRIERAKPKPKAAGAKK